jgi:hypothetical protein
MNGLQTKDTEENYGKISQQPVSGLHVKQVCAAKHEWFAGY